MKSWKNLAKWGMGCVSSILLSACMTMREEGDFPGLDLVAQPNQLMNLGREIDHLEHHIDKYGSIVAQQPAIWGEARLTKHRQEFEKQMYAQLNSFTDTLNGYIARSDQAFLYQALALSAAVQGTTLKDVGSQQSTTNLNLAQNLVPNTTVTDPSGKQTFTNQVPGLTPSAPFQLLGQKKDGTASIPVPVPQNIQLEPTVSLDQRARFLNHLHELRRINEGDDTADSPGYALNLVRVPISILPGKCTRAGHGAEITITATPVLSDELLPITFRNLVQNDLIDLLGIPVSSLVEELSNHQTMFEAEEVVKGPFIQPATLVQNAPANPMVRLKQGKAVEQKYNVKRTNPETNSLLPPAQTAQSAGVNYQQSRQAFIKYALARSSYSNKIATTSQRRARTPLPPSQIVAVIGENELVEIANVLVTKNVSGELNKSLILDVHKYLSAELFAAYDLMRQPHFQEGWWHTPMPKQLAQAIRSNNAEALSHLKMTVNQLSSHWPQISTATQALAWAICVESALLEEALVQDIHEQMRSKGCACTEPEGQCFGGPNPAPGAREIFKQYVQCRWPIHVFALDPVTQDENLEDLFSRRRESQLAVSLAFASGKISASSFTKYVRRLETDMSTIALHRTVAGFSHGNDTFGWRFMPRFQTPPFESNATVLFRDLIWGGPSRDAELRKANIEPGQRECIALVIMPSFVPYVTFDTRSNWFSLTNPKHTQISMKETLKLSASIKRMQSCSRIVGDAGCYRDGEVERLLKRVHQLSAELPLQTMTQQVPIENTLGGFAFFSKGMTDLAPQLTGFYGEPGVQKGRDTTLYLIGDHFSIHDTKVLAGNKNCDFSLLSRRCIQVTIPADVRPTKGSKEKEENSIDVHVATPYGVSGHLEVPYDEHQDPSTGTTFRLIAPTAYTVSYKFDKSAAGAAKVTSMSSAVPPGQDLAVQLPQFYNTNGAFTLLISLSEDGKLLPALDAATMEYDSATNRMVVTSSNLITMNTKITDVLKNYLAAFPGDPRTHLITMTLRLKGPTVTVPLTPPITISLEFDPTK